MLKKTLFALALLALPLAAEEAKITFENCEPGPLNGQQGFACSSNVLVASSLPVSQTNDILVGAWHYHGKQAAISRGPSSLEKNFDLPESGEQRLAFDFYPTFPDSLKSKTATVFLGGSPVLRFTECGANFIAMQVFGRYAGGTSVWQSIPGVEDFKHRKWQHVELLFSQDLLLKVKTPYKDAELAGFHLDVPLPEKGCQFKIESGLEGFSIDNLEFKNCLSLHRTIHEAGNVGELKEAYETPEFGEVIKGGLEISFSMAKPAADAKSKVVLMSGESPLLTLDLVNGLTLLDGSGQKIKKAYHAPGSHDFSFGILKSGRLVKFGYDGLDTCFSNVWLAKDGLPSNLRLFFADTSGNTNAITSLEKVFAQDSLPIAYGTTHSIDVLMPVYTGNGSRTPLKDYTNVYFPKTKEFYYRNSRGNFLILYDPMYRHIKPPAETFFRYYENEFGQQECGGSIMARDLRKWAGIWKEEYDLFLFTSGDGWADWGGNWGGGSYGYTGLGKIMCSQTGNYGGEGTSFLNIHEIMHSVDQMYSYSGRHEFPSSHPQDSIYGWSMGGDTWSWCGNAMRPFEHYDDLMDPWQQAYIYRDSDQDRLADEDWLLPADEARMHTDPGNTDSDQDGLDDMEEYLAGLYYPSDPNNADTDNDGIIDGQDPIPLSNYRYQIPRMVKEPTFDGHIDDGEWTCWGDTIIDTQDKNFTARAYAGWREDAIYFAFKTNKKCGFMLEVDGSPLNSPWNGGDYFKFKIPNQYMNRMYAASKDGNGVQDWKCGVVPTGSRVMKTVNGEGGFTVEAKIPCRLKNVQGYTNWEGESPTNFFACALGQKLAFLFSFDAIGQNRGDLDTYRVEPYASSFERYDWHYFELVEAKTPFALISAEPINGDLHIGTKDQISLQYVNYGQTAQTAITIESLGPASYSSKAQAAIQGDGQQTNVIQAITIPDDQEAIAQTDFRIITALNGQTITNTFTWNVIPEPATATALILSLLALAAGKRP